MGYIWPIVHICSVLRNRSDIESGYKPLYDRNLNPDLFLKNVSSVISLRWLLGPFSLTLCRKVAVKQQHFPVLIL